jgi:predicted transcriptional regulator
MSGSSEQAEHEATTNDAQRRLQELDLERSRLHDRVVEIAESVRRSHERTAQTLENLADTGPAEHATRRRRAAERSRRLAEEETRQLAQLTGQGSPESNQARHADDQSDADPS